MLLGESCLFQLLLWVKEIECFRPSHKHPSNHVSDLQLLRDVIEYLLCRNPYLTNSLPQIAGLLMANRLEHRSYPIILSTAASLHQQYQAFKNGKDQTQPSGAQTTTQSSTSICVEPTRQLATHTSSATKKPRMAQNSSNGSQLNHGATGVSECPATVTSQPLNGKLPVSALTV